MGHVGLYEPHQGSWILLKANEKPLQNFQYGADKFSSLKRSDSRHSRKIRLRQGKGGLQETCLKSVASVW